MKNTAYYILGIVLFCASFVACKNSKNETANSKAQSLLKQMSLEQKVGQMAQITLDVLGKKQAPDLPFLLDDEKVTDAIVKYKIGSVLNTSNNKAMSANGWNEIVGELQKKALTTDLKIPLVYGFDAIHGATYVAAATFFPQQVGQAATWNPKLVFDAAAITAYESRAAGVPWNFSPVLDLGVNPLWPRLWETFGEDPYLVTQMGVQAVNGFQNSNDNKTSMAACLKHFLAYSDPKSGKDRTNAWIPEHYLREYHLPAFRAAVNAGAKTLMVNSALINGIPTHVNKYLLTDVLKNELGFKGLVVTDWQDIENVFKRDKLATSNKEALMMAINAGIDMAMIPYDYKTFCDDLVALVNEGKVSKERIDDAVLRILQLKYELGLFETPVTNAKDYPKFASVEFEKVAYDAAAESITLLKDSANILPLKAGVKLLVTGPNANSMRTLNGGWSYSWQGEKTELFAAKYNTIFKALQNKVGATNVNFVAGVEYKMNGKYYEDSIVNIDAVVRAASGVDYVVLCVGENSYTEKPGDLNDLNLSENQLALINAVIKTKKPVILILNEGRPRIINKIEPYMSAIVQTYLPGNFGGDALADVLLGNINPSGKLPYTYPRFVNAFTNYIHKPSDEQSNPQGAYDYSADYNPQYDFGFGLSYTTFEYNNLKLSKTSVTAEDSITISVNVKNTGSKAGKEVVQLFVSDLVASLSPDMKRLRGFEKINLQAGEEKLVSFTIAVKDLAFINTSNKWQLEQGAFKVAINKLHQNFELTQTTSW